MLSRDLCLNLFIKALVILSITETFLGIKASFLVFSLAASKASM